MSISAVASSTELNLTGTYIEKKTASEFWSEFKQDSEQTWHDSNSAFRDGWIEGKLATALSLNKHLDIEVDTLNDNVTLSGNVKSLAEKALAQAIAAKHNDVKCVVNNLQVRS